MRRLYWLPVVVLAVLGVSCSSDNEYVQAEPEMVVCRFGFTAYDVEGMTRAETSISSVVSRLDVWVEDGNGGRTAVHQTNSDSEFGSLTMTLDKTKTYTVTAVGHKAGGEATLTNGVIAFPEEKVTHSMVYRTTFSPSTTTELSCSMSRIVGMFRMTTTDAVPDEVVKMVFELGESPTRWNVAGYGVNAVERTSTFSSISRKADGSASFSVYVISSADEATEHTITVTALDSEDEVVQQRVFEDVPIRNGYRTSYEGSFFIDTPMSMAFTVGDWSEYETVEF